MLRNILAYTGFSDTFAFLREMTQKSMFILAPKLSQRTTTGSLLNYIFVWHALIGHGGVMAFCATSSYNDTMEFATRILPNIVVLTIDPDSDVRSKAFQVVDQFLQIENIMMKRSIVEILLELQAWECLLEMQVCFEDKEGTFAGRRGRSRKRRNIQEKKLFDEQESSEEDESIGASDQEGPEEEDQDEEEAPLIHSFKSAAKLRSLRVQKQGSKSKDSRKAHQQDASDSRMLGMRSS